MGRPWPASASGIRPPEAMWEGRFRQMHPKRRRLLVNWRSNIQILDLNADDRQHLIARLARPAMLTGFERPDGCTPTAKIRLMLHNVRNWVVSSLSGFSKNFEKLPVRTRQHCGHQKIGWGYRPPASEVSTPPWLPSGSASLHLRATMAPEAILH